MTQLTLFAPPSTAAPDEPEDAKTYLWVNVPDLDDMGTIPGFGTPLNFMIRPELGDERLPGGWYSPERLDENYIIIHTTVSRANALTDALEMMSKRKIKRAIRTRRTASTPQSGWRYIPER